MTNYHRQRHGEPAGRQQHRAMPSTPVHIVHRTAIRPNTLIPPEQPNMLTSERGTTALAWMPSTSSRNTASASVRDVPAAGRSDLVGLSVVDHPGKMGRVPLHRAGYALTAPPRSRPTPNYWRRPKPMAPAAPPAPASAPAPRPDLRTVGRITAFDAILGIGQSGRNRTWASKPGSRRPASPSPSPRLPGPPSNN